MDGMKKPNLIKRVCVCSKAMAILWMHMDAAPSYCYIELGAPNLLIFWLKKPRIFNVEVPWSQDWHLLQVQGSQYFPVGGVSSHQWEFQDPKMEVPTIYKAYIRPMQVNIITKYGLIWYSTSILGSWNSHWSHAGTEAVGTCFHPFWKLLDTTRAENLFTVTHLEAVTNCHCLARLIRAPGCVSGLATCSCLTYV